jgi:hypothetical protein
MTLVCSKSELFLERDFETSIVNNAVGSSKTHGIFITATTQAHILHPNWLYHSSFPVAIHAENVYNSETLC